MTSSKLYNWEKKEWKYFGAGLLTAMAVGSISKKTTQGFEYGFSRSIKVELFTQLALLGFKVYFSEDIECVQ